ncbi:hypothetical protein WIW50_12920 [Flavobacteriaceae bacterium 3-367]|uniref:hypothetical protein n=1 Tax=Eudoraea algarum TaxID=3417568 RepID=UPI0032904C9A
MIKPIIPLLSLLLFCVSCYSPQRDCESYRTGTFRFDYELEGVLKSGTFTRTDAYSIEFFEHKTDSANVKWINDCEFVLRPLDNKAAIHYKIISTTDSSYTFEYKRAVKDPKKKLIVKKGTAIKTD